MSDLALILFHVSRAVFLASNILLTYSFLTPSRPVWFQVVAYAGAWIFHSSLRILLVQTGLDTFLVSYMLTIVYFIPFLLIFRETIHAKFFVLFMVTSFSQFIFLISLFIEHLLFGQMVGGLILLGQLVELTAIVLFRKYIIPYVKNILEIIDRQNPVFTLFPFLSFILLAFYGVQRNYILSIFIPLVLSTMIIAVSYHLIAISIERTKRQHALEKQLALQRDHYCKLNESIAAAKATRHDLRHHLVTARGFLEKKDAVAAKEYLNRLCNACDDSSIPSVCRNQSADALICHYVTLAKQEDIAVVTNLDIPDDLGIDDIDLCVIIGNCLENSIEACRKQNIAEARYIDINAKINKEYLVIKIENSFNGFVQQQNDAYISSKKGTESGIGIGSIKTLAAKYQGHCMISFDQQIFKVSVSLKLAENIATRQSRHIA